MSNHRAATTLLPPDPSRDYSSFPTYKHKDRLRWFRAHERSYSPWWFSSTSGRFNLYAPRGTLNVGSSLTTALRESLGPVLLGTPDLPETALTGRTVSCLEIPGLAAADFLHEAAPTFGVLAGDAAASVDADYSVTRAWAAALDQAGMEGIRSRSRCGAGADPQCLYIFGKAGEHEIGEILQGESRSATAVATEMAGYSIISVPDSGSLVIDP